MADWLAEAIATGDVERVPANMGAVGERINDARRHVHSARRIAESDTTLAIAACHDAIRKALTGHMTARGLRVRRGEGAHRITLDYARRLLAGTISERDLAETNEIRGEYSPLIPPVVAAPTRPVLGRSTKGGKYSPPNLTGPHPWPTASLRLQ